MNNNHHIDYPFQQQQQHQQQLINNNNNNYQSLMSTTTTSGTTTTHPLKLFTCLICCCFHTNSLDELNAHLLMDRTRTTGTSSSSSSSSLSLAATTSATTTNTTTGVGGVGVVTTTNGSCNDNDIVVVVNNNYICRLCNYKTNLKANFQLHSKTDKHLQKLNLLNHIKEGGIMNEYKLIKFQQQQHQLPTNLIHIKCNCCDFYTNSMQKLTLHVQNMRHDAMAIVQQHLIYLLQQQQQQQDDSDINKPNNDKSDNKMENIEKSLEEDDDNKEDVEGEGGEVSKKKGAIVKKNQHKKLLYCQLCNYIAIHLLDMLQHVNCLQHLQMEQFVCLQRRCDNLDTPTLHDIFKLCDDHHHQQNQHSQPIDATKPASMTPTETTSKIGKSR